MNQSDIYTATQTELRNRLVLVEYSTLPAQAREAEQIKRELARRVGCRIVTKFPPLDLGRTAGAVERLANPVHGQAAAPHALKSRLTPLNRSEEQRARLLYKYAHVGCPAARYDDNCPHPGDCADNGRCKDLGASPFDPDEPIERPSQTFGPVADLKRGISVSGALLCQVCDGRGVYESADIKTAQRIEFECYECDGRGWLRDV